MSYTKFDLVATRESMKTTEPDALIGKVAKL